MAGERASSWEDEPTHAWADGRRAEFAPFGAEGKGADPALRVISFRPPSPSAAMGYVPALLSLTPIRIRRRTRGRGRLGRFEVGLAAAASLERVVAELGAGAGGGWVVAGVAVSVVARRALRAGGVPGGPRLVCVGRGRGVRADGLARARAAGGWCGRGGRRRRCGGRRRERPGGGGGGVSGTGSAGGRSGAGVRRWGQAMTSRASASRAAARATLPQRTRACSGSGPSGSMSSPRPRGRRVSSPRGGRRWAALAILAAACLHTIPCTTSFSCSTARPPTSSVSGCSPASSRRSPPAERSSTRRTGAFGRWRTRSATRPTPSTTCCSSTARARSSRRLQRTLKIADGVMRFRIIKLAPGTPAPPANRPEPRPTGIGETVAAAPEAPAPVAEPADAVA